MIKWLKPSLVAEIEFADWTGDNQLREAAFKCVREDKEPPAITIERPILHNDDAAKAGAPAASHALVRASNVKLTNPNKILWPETADTPAVTKLDLAAYLAAVAERIMPHIEGRPCSILRTPDGIDGITFFQRHADKGASNLITRVRYGDNKKPYIQFDRPEALIAAAQSGATELHPWNCQPFDLETPGRLVFDLDPAPDVNFDAVIIAAKEMKQRLEALGLTPFCKTTGGKGLHVVTPLAKPRSGVLRWPEAKTFAREVCAQMAADSAQLYLIKMSKKEREGRIFLDYLRNDQTATAVAPYSPRARPGATVSMPLKWTQVRKGLNPKAFNMLTIPALIAKPNPWADYAKAGGSFAAAARRLGLR
jgi:bifunctional non-homologous end joining protein LigD